MKRIVVIGGAESGSGAAVLARKQGFDVFLTDNAPIPQRYRKLLEDNMIAFEEGQHSLELILNADEVIKSPGVPDKAPLIQTIKAKGIPVVSEIEFAGRYTKAKMICITGSNGKTTTTLLTYHILKNGGLNVGLAGNIGQSFALQVAQQDYDYYVIELSSFQLDYMFKFKADVAVMLNITPDHLDRYHYNLQEYVDSKFRIIQNQTEQDAFIYWNDDPIIQREIKKRTIRAKTYPFSLKKDAGIKAFIEDKILVINTPDQQFEIEQEALALRGTHNLYNTMASAISANIAHIRKEEIRTALSNFKGVEHRLEKVAGVAGVEYINDSKATNVNSCWYALESVNTPVVLIMGGTDKGNDYGEIEALVRQKVKAIVCLGVDNTKLHDFFEGKVDEIRDARSMQEAVDLASSLATKGDTVLLSPCCASFDLFENYEDRGRQFKDCVRNL